MPIDPRRVLRRSRRTPGASADRGFTLIEVLVSVTLMGIVMTALTTFFVNSLSLMGQQRTRQVGVQLASDAVERVRALRGAAVDDGRGQGATTYAAPGVAAYLTDMQQWNVAGGTDTLTLPLGAEAKDINGLRYNKYWYVGRCWQPETGGDCGLARTTDDVEFFRVVVAITWRDTRCPAGLCSYITATLVSSAPRDPVFNSNDSATPPTLDDPGDQTHDVTVVVSLPLTYSGGSGTLTWGATGLPPGLSISANGVISGTLQQAGAQPWNVLVTLTDGFGLVADADFTWTVNALPVLTRPPDQKTAVGNAVSLPIPLTGGTPTLTWSVTGTWSSSGLPQGLSFNSTTRTISGTPTTAGSAKDVTIRVTDRFGKTSAVTFSWLVSSLSLSNPGAQSSPLNSSRTLNLSVSGGSTPRTWTATGLPPGLAINASSGVISGNLSTPNRYVVTAVVTDNAGVIDSVSFVWTVTTNSGLRITSTTGDRTSTAGSNTSFTLTASGGTGYTWTATGLPSGVTISSGGVVSGRPTPAGVYVCTVTVRDSTGATANYMFTWTVT